METEIRQTGICALQTVMTKKENCEVFEKYIYEQVKEEGDEEIYKWIIYQVVGLLLQDMSTMKSTLKEVKKGKIGWNSTTYDNIRAKLDEHDDYIVTPFEVVDGVLSCPKCHGTKTWSVQRQQRSCDEPMTTFSKCVNCGNSWAYAG